MDDDRSGDAAPAEALERMHVVDLGNAVVLVELAEARRGAVDVTSANTRRTAAFVSAACGVMPPWLA